MSVKAQPEADRIKIFIRNAVKMQSTIEDAKLGNIPPNKQDLINQLSRFKGSNGMRD
jgi:hypothetical protein